MGNSSQSKSLRYLMEASKNLKKTRLGLTRLVCEGLE